MDGGVGEEMVGLRDGCGVDGEGSRVGTTREVATSGRPAGAMLVPGLSVVLGLVVAAAVRVAASSFGASGFGGRKRPITCTAFSTSVMSWWSSVPTR